MKKILVATSNPNKIYEMNLIFKSFNYDVELISPKDLGNFDDPVEDGKTYEENAIIKAKHFYDLFKMPTIADDSGLRITFLNEFPGIYSARFMKNHSYEVKCDELIKVLDDAPNRDAYFDCVVAYIDENGKTFTFKGENKGTIAYQRKGNEGFGYDPIFVVPEFNKTEAELGFEYKNKHSHRAKAMAKLIEYLKEHE